MCPTIYKVGWEWNEIIQKAYDYSECDMEFIALLEAENDQWTVDRVGPTNDHGLCQISQDWHPWIVGHPEFYDVDWQIDRCLYLWRTGETFYGAANIPNTINRFYTK